MQLIEWRDEFSIGLPGVDRDHRQLIADINDFQSAEAGSAEFKRLGRQLVENMVSNLLFIGTVNAPAPIYHRNALKNFVPFKLHGTEYHRAYPYRPTQWYLADGG